MGNVGFCRPLDSQTVFQTSTRLFQDAQNPNGALGLVDPNGFGNCDAAIDFFQDEKCVPSTAALTCVLELPDQDRPDKIELCPGTDIWITDFSTFTIDDAFLDLTGIEQIKCQDDTCRFLKTIAPLNQNDLPCPFFLNNLEDFLKIKDSSFLDFELTVEAEERGNGIVRIFLPFDPISGEGVDESLKSDEDSALVCQNAIVSNEGTLEEVEVEDGTIKAPKSPKSKKKGKKKSRNLRATSMRPRKPSRGATGSKGSEFGRSLSSSSESSRSLLEVNDPFDAKLLRVWECMQGDLNGSLTLTMQDLKEKESCIMSPVVL